MREQIYVKIFQICRNCFFFFFLLYIHSDYFGTKHLRDLFLLLEGIYKTSDLYITLICKSEENSIELFSQREPLG